MCQTCLECGETFTATNRGRGSAPIFCADTCKKTFNNRRMLRGARIFDLMMICRYERGTAKVRGVWAILCEVCRQWREEDRRDRGGRPSWRSYDELHDGLAPYRATVIGSVGASSQRVAVENGIAARSRAA